MLDCYYKNNVALYFFCWFTLGMIVSKNREMNRTEEPLRRMLKSSVEFNKTVISLNKNKLKFTSTYSTREDN